MRYEITIELTNGQMELIKKLGRTKKLYEILKTFNIGDQDFIEVNKEHLSKIFKYK